MLNMENSQSGQSGADFSARDFSEVVKVRRCSYANDEECTSYFICNQVDQIRSEFFPICEACAVECHKDHRPARIQVDGFGLTCKCGEAGHKLEVNSCSKVGSERDICLYGTFENVKLFTCEDGKVLCEICIQLCAKQAACEPGEPGEPGEKHTCHFLNVLTMNADLERIFSSHNFNILDKSPITRAHYLLYLQRYISSGNSGDDMFALKILELFSSWQRTVSNP